MLNNFLLSGFVFEENNFDLKYKYILVNILLLCNAVFVFLASILRFYQDNILQGSIDIIYTSIAISIIILLRKYKNLFDLLVKFSILFSLIIVSISYYNMYDSIGVSWFIILLFSTIFLLNYEYNVITFIAVLSIIIYITYIKNDLYYDFFFTILPLLIGFNFMMFYKKVYDNKNTMLLNLNNKLSINSSKLENSLDMISKHVNYSKTDLNGVITEVSDMFCEVSKFTKDELIGQQHNITRHPDMPAHIFKNMWDTIQKGKTWKGKIKNKTKDGEFYWTDCVINPKFDKNKKIIGYMAVRHNTTAQEELKDLVINLESLVQNKIDQNNAKELILFDQAKKVQLGEMIGNIAHQWKQPLSIISTLASTINISQECGTLDDKKIKDNMNTILFQTNYLSDTIDIFKNFLKEDKKKQEVIIQERISISATIVEPIMKDYGIDLQNNVNYLNPINMKIIAGELTEVLVNIINNSKDALLENNIKNPWIKISLDSDDHKVIIIIEDNAGGIPKEILPKIFDPYFTTKSDENGTGIGLYMSQRIIKESLNGKLYAKNTINGACFFIELPIL